MLVGLLLLLQSMVLQLRTKDVQEEFCTWRSSQGGCTTIWGEGGVSLSCPLCWLACCPQAWQ